MIEAKYSFQGYKENMACAKGTDMDVSFKTGIELCRFLRGKTVERAKEILEDILAYKQPVPYTRFTNGVGHKPGVGPGKYPQKAAKQIFALIESAEANALNKGLSEYLKIVHISAQKSGVSWHYGRQTRRRMKRIHVEVVVEEYKAAEKKVAKKKQKVKQESMLEVKKEEKKIEHPKEEQPMLEIKKEEKKTKTKEKKSVAAIKHEVNKEAKPKNEIKKKPKPKKEVNK